MGDYYGLNFFTKAALVSVFVLAIVFMVMGTFFGEQGPGQVLFAEEELVKEDAGSMVAKGVLMVSGSNGLSFFNTTIPDKLVLVGRLLDFKVDDLVITKKVVVAVGSGRLFIINASSPKIQLASSLDLQCSRLSNVFVNQEKAYVTCNEERPILMIIDIKNPAAPLFLSSTPTDNKVEQIVFASQEQAFILLEGGAIQSWDLSNDLLPQRKSEIRMEEAQFIKMIN
jgi:hypothetical protein